MLHVKQSIKYHYSSMRQPKNVYFCGLLSWIKLTFAGGPARNLPVSSRACGTICGCCAFITVCRTRWKQTQEHFVVIKELWLRLKPLFLFTLPLPPTTQHEHAMKQTVPSATNTISFTWTFCLSNDKLNNTQ